VLRICGRVSAELPGIKDELGIKAWNKGFWNKELCSQHYHRLPDCALNIRIFILLHYPMSVEVNHRPDMPSRPLFQAFIPSLYSRQLSLRLGIKAWNKGLK